MKHFLEIISLSFRQILKYWNFVVPLALLYLWFFVAMAWGFEELRAYLFARPKLNTGIYKAMSALHWIICVATISGLACQLQTFWNNSRYNPDPLIPFTFPKDVYWGYFLRILLLCGFVALVNYSALRVFSSLIFGLQGDPFVPISSSLITTIRIITICSLLVSLPITWATLRLIPLLPSYAAKRSLSPRSVWRLTQRLSLSLFTIALIYIGTRLIWFLVTSEMSYQALGRANQSMIFYGGGSIFKLTSPWFPLLAVYLASLIQAIYRLPFELSAKSTVAQIEFDHSQDNVKLAKDDEQKMLPPAQKAPVETKKTEEQASENAAQKHQKETQRAISESKSDPEEKIRKSSSRTDKPQPEDDAILLLKDPIKPQAQSAEPNPPSKNERKKSEAVDDENDTVLLLKNPITDKKN